VKTGFEEMEAVVETSQEELKVIYLEANPEASEVIVDQQEVHNEEMNVDVIKALKGSTTDT
jgi:hypothetical protein